MRTFLVILLLAAGLAVNLLAAPAAYPLTVDSRAQTMPKLTVYRASAVQFALSYKDGATANNLTGQTPWMSWSTNASAATCCTATVVIVTATNGTATASFTVTDMNYAPGRYIYEVGTSTGGVKSVYRQGVLEIVGSPYATGAGAVMWTMAGAPASNTATGSGGQWAAGITAGTNYLYFYDPNGAGTGTGRWLRVTANATW